MSQLNKNVKKNLTHIMGWRPARYLLRWAVVLFAPRHRVGVNVVCLDSQDRILLLNHVFHPQVPWGLPGGWLAPGERPQDGALRELREETGLQVDLAETLVIERGYLSNHIEIIFLALVGDDAVRQARPASGEINELCWFAPQDLPARLTRTTRLALNRAWAKRAVSPPPQAASQMIQL